MEHYRAPNSALHEASGYKWMPWVGLVNLASVLVIAGFLVIMWFFPKPVFPTNTVIDVASAAGILAVTLLVLGIPYLAVLVSLYLLAFRGIRLAVWLNISFVVAYAALGTYYLKDGFYLRGFLAPAIPMVGCILNIACLRGARISSGTEASVL